MALKQNYEQACGF